MEEKNYSYQIGCWMSEIKLLISKIIIINWISNIFFGFNGLGRMRIVIVKIHVCSSGNSTTKSHKKESAPFVLSFLYCDVIVFATSNVCVVQNIIMKAYTSLTLHFSQLVSFACIIIIDTIIGFDIYLRSHRKKKNSRLKISIHSEIKHKKEL